MKDQARARCTPLTNASVRSALLAIFILVSGSSASHAQEATSQRWESAVLPLPESLRAEAGVIRWSGPALMEQLRPSRNGMSCTVDDPSDDRFDVRCYHDDFWAVIRRARELRQELDTWEDVSTALRDEAESGEIEMPSAPTAGYRMLGPIGAYDPSTGTAGSEIAKWQSIHFPFRTAREMGLPEVEEPSESGLPGLMPYVMASGTWWSHVMIVHEPFE